MLAHLLNEGILRFIESYRSKGPSTSKRIMQTTKGIGILSIDAFLRYRNVSKLLIPNTVLDAGAATGSKLSLYRQDIRFISCDIMLGKGVDVVGDIRFLPFKSKSFDAAAAVDVLEHLPKEYRNLAIKELTRVAKKRVIVHMPLQDDVQYKGRNYDLLFSDLYRRIRKKPNAATEEHLSHQYWSPNNLMKHNFKLTGTCNTKIWIIHMIISNCFPYPIGIWLAWMTYVLFLKWLDNKPPYWGAVAQLSL